MEPTIIGNEHVRVVKDGERHPLHYDPSVFVAETLEASKEIILINGEAGLTTEQRWERETDWLMERIQFPGTNEWQDRLILDYGCGVGRIAKRITNPVIGVDLSSTMRWHAETYVGRPDFATTNPPMLEQLVRSGLRCGGGLAVWVLQHVVAPMGDVQLIASAITPGGTFWLVNRDIRVVPVKMSDGTQDWATDDLNVESMLLRWFKLEARQEMPADLCIEGAFISEWKRNTRAVDGGAS